MVIIHYLHPPPDIVELVLKSEAPPGYLNIAHLLPLYQKAHRRALATLLLCAFFSSFFSSFPTGSASSTPCLGFVAAGAASDSLASEVTELFPVCDRLSVATTASVTGSTLERRRYHFECLARKGSMNGSSKWEPLFDGRSTGRSETNGAAAIGF
jgi:hypothetical protein